MLGFLIFITIYVGGYRRLLARSWATFIWLIQYNMENQDLDVFYLRLLSDFGLIPVLIMHYSFFTVAVIKVFFRGNNLRSILFLFLYSFFNEGLLVIKTGHICAFLIG